ncbi:MAG: ABC transporter ATP-binding protein [Candidatus Berkiellales bacterium]
MINSTMIDIQHLSVIFDQEGPTEHIALDNINLTVQEGEFLVVLGCNGAGKTTLMKALAGETPIARGSIIVDNKDITHLPKYARTNKISRICQDPLRGTFAHLTIEENLTLAYKRGQKRRLTPAINKSRRNHFKSLLNLLGLELENKLALKMGLLSGGQRQAVCLIMAFLQDAKVLLLDEHTAALDPIMSERIMQLTSQLVKEHGLTTVMITHDHAQAIKYGSRTIVMQQGKIIEDKKAKTSTERTGNVNDSLFSMDILPNFIR